MAAPIDTAPPVAALSTLLSNRANEPEFQLELSVEAIKFAYNMEKKAVWCDVAIKNPTPDRQAFRVKCTNTKIYFVQPPSGFVKVAETKIIRLFYVNEAIPENDHFTFLHVKATSPRLQENSRTWLPDGVRRLPVVCQPTVENIQVLETKVSKLEEKVQQMEEVIKALEKRVKDTTEEDSDESEKPEKISK